MCLTHNYWHCCCQVASVMSNSVRPHRRQPTRFPRPWESPGKNAGVGCHFLLRCMKVKSESEVTQSCLTLSMDCSPPGPSVYGIFQARVLEWGAIAFSTTDIIHMHMEAERCYHSSHFRFYFGIFRWYYIQLALCICGFCILKFNQPRIKNIWKKILESSKKQNEFCCVLATVYIAFPLY